MTGATGSTGVPTDRSTMPSGCDRACADASASVSHGNSGSDADTRRRVSVRLGAFTLRRQVLDGLRVVLGHTDLRRASRRPELIEKVGVQLRVLRPLVGHVVLVVDGLDGADR